MLPIEQQNSRLGSRQSPNMDRNNPLDDQNRPASAPDPTLLMKSAALSQRLLSDAQKVTENIVSSKTFSQKLMNAAKDSKMGTVNELIRQTGVKTLPEVRINPDGIRLNFQTAPAGEADTHVIILLKWMNF